METINSTYEQSIIEILRKKINENRIDELNIALDDIRAGNINGNEMIDIIESTYEFNMQKLEEVKDLSNKNLQKRKKFASMFSLLEGMPISDSNMLAAMLTSGAILNRFDCEPEKIKDFNLYSLASALVSIPLKNYPIYKAMVDDELLDNVREKCGDQTGVRNVLESFLECCEVGEITSKDLMNVLESKNKIEEGFKKRV